MQSWDLIFEQITIPSSPRPHLFGWVAPVNFKDNMMIYGLHVLREETRGESQSSDSGINFFPRSSTLFPSPFGVLKMLQVINSNFVWKVSLAVACWLGSS